MIHTINRLSLLSVLLFLTVVHHTYADSSKISVVEAHELSTKGDVILVDIRSIEEWQQTGIAPQAIPLTIHQKGGIPRFSEQLLELLEGNKNKPIALICAGGVRSARVQKYLSNQGFSNVSDVTEGMVGGWFTEGWVEQGLPIKNYKKQ